MHQIYVSHRTIVKAMKSNPKKHASVLDNAPELSPGLAQKIISRIERYERRLFLAKKVGFGACVAGSVTLTGFGFENAATELSRSGFFSFAALIFSDFSSALANFPDFFLSVAESIPAIPIALFFGGIVFFLWSISQWSLNTRSYRAYQWSASK